MDLLNRIKTYLDHRARVNETVRELRSLTDRELHDIGISRADIHEIASQATDTGPVDVYEWRSRKDAGAGFQPHAA